MTITTPLTTSSYINRISDSTGKTYNIQATSLTDAVFDEIVDRLKSRDIKYKSISCIHCGAPITMQMGDHIAKCQYCHSVYAIDMELIRDIGDEYD